mmetsp:Transcript_15528/g.40122  ORF Transcript_15528/g.40122 Transcript_15528/m.40122 type:complete len:451 (-) Transcript_15528:392-1744(-)
MPRRNNDGDGCGGVVALIVCTVLGISTIVTAVEALSCKEQWVANSTAQNATFHSCDDKDQSGEFVWGSILLICPAMVSIWILIVVLFAAHDCLSSIVDRFRRTSSRSTPDVNISPTTTNLARQLTNTVGTPVRVARETATVAMGAIHIELPVVAREARVEDSTLRAVLNDLTAGERHAECCICFEPLHEEKGATFLAAGSKRACAHYFHARCAHDLMSSNFGGSQKTCPVCRTEVARVLEVPTVTEDPGGWFFCVDVDGAGRLSRREVLNVLVTQFPIDLEKLEANLATLWSRWDIDGSGFLTREDFVDPERGLLNWVRVHLLHELSTIEASEAEPEVPSSPVGQRQPAEWFAICDDSGNGRLTRDQLERALVKSTKRGHVKIRKLLDDPKTWQPPRKLRINLRGFGRGNKNEVYLLEDFLLVHQALESHTTLATSLTSGPHAGGVDDAV